MAYDIFEVVIDSGKMHVQRTAGMGTTRARQLRLPEEPRFSRYLDLLRLEPTGSTQEERLADLGRMLKEIEEAGGFGAVTQDVGEALFNALFPKNSQAVRVYTSALDEAIRNGNGLSVALSFGASVKPGKESVLTLPWEYLYDPEKGFFLGTSGNTLLARRIVQPGAVPPFRANVPMKVLVVISEPHDQQPFGRERAWQQLETGLTEASDKGAVVYRKLARPALGAMTEEIVRLRSHAQQFREILGSEGAGNPVGRRLEFLLQEFGREANTIGAKGSDAPISHEVVSLKTELERIREQVQNVE